MDRTMDCDRLDGLRLPQGRRVLLATPDDAQHHPLSAQLQHVGLTVTVVNNNHHAVEATLVSDFDVILLDTDYASDRTLKIINLIRGSGNFTPIIVFIDPTRTPDWADTVPTLSKPVDFALLHTKLRDYLPATALPQQSTEIDDDFLALQQAFLAALDSDYLDDLYQALHDQSPANAQAALHKLKGAAGSFGLTTLSTLAAQAETELRQSHSPQRLRQAIQPLLNEVKKLRYQ
jgi:HPt (histidine-containing phosphotransfer) domain-containing protein